MRSNLRTIIDDLPCKKEFDDDPKVALTVRELAAASGISDSYMGKLARDKANAGDWERLWRHTHGGCAVQVYRLKIKKKK